jgi:hypothetical protein
LTIPIFENASTQTTSPYGNNIPGWTLTAAGFSILNGMVLIPVDSTVANMKIDCLVASATSGQARFGVSFAKVADGGAINGALTSLSSQDISLTANTLKKVQFTTSSVGTVASMFHVRFFRDGDHANDTLAASAFLHAITLTYDATI